MKETENLKLNIYEGTDTVKRIDFNADNEKIDAGYKELLEQCKQLGIYIENIDVTEDLDALAEELRKEIAQRVIKEDGKGLSTNDYTNQDKALVGTVKDKADKTYVDEQDESLMKEIDSLKLSGVESNKILVDALNSKEVQASTRDTIKTNVNKVNDIKVGDYKIGDNVTNKLDIVINKGPIWSYYNDWVKSVATDTEDNVIGGINKKVIKLSPTGDELWEFTGHTSTSYQLDILVATDSSDNIISASKNDKVIKLSPTGDKLWEFTGHNSYVDSVATDSQDNVIIGGGTNDKVMKINKNGTKVWELTGTSRVNSVTTDSQDNIIYGNGPNDFNVIKVTPQGRKLWEFAERGATMKSVATDSNDNVIIGSSYQKVIKLSLTGDKLWEFTGYGDAVNSVATDSEDNIISGSSDKRVLKISGNYPLESAILK